MRTDNIDLVIFDCDGVLIDSEVLSMQAWNSVLANYDIALTKQYFIENFLGKSMEHVRSKIEEDFALSLTPSLEGEFHTLLFHAFERHLTATSGIIDVLSSLRVPFCVATSSSPERTEKALKSTGLITYFNDRIFTRSLVSRGKPAPDLFLYAANALNCSPRTCLVIEDSQPDNWTPPHLRVWGNIFVTTQKILKRVLNMYRTKVGVDLAKNIIQVCTLHGKKVTSNVEMSTDEFSLWLAQTKPVTVAFEACSTSNYWYQQAIKAGHDARLISAKLVKAVRQNQKTDKNDALAIAQTLFLPEVSFINGKNIEQQQLQSIQRLRELAIKSQNASQKQIVSLLLELNIRLPNTQAGLLNGLEGVLEDGENNLSDTFRATLLVAKVQLENMISAIREYDKYLEQSIQSLPDCKKLLKLEGVGPVNAVNLYIALGANQSQPFKSGKNASACIGLTPIQHSSGGKEVMGTIGKYCKNGSLRSQLITGAMSVVIKVIKYGAKTKKELWLQGLMQRRGNRCAAVALANKTVRTAYSMLQNNTEYHAA